MPYFGQGGAFVDRSGTIAAGGVAQTLAAVNTSRSFIQVFNASTGDLWINWTTAAVVGQPSMKIPANTLYESAPNALSTELISIIGATTGQAFSAKEL